MGRFFCFVLSGSRSSDWAEAADERNPGHCKQRRASIHRSFLHCSVAACKPWVGGTILSYPATRFIHNLARISIPVRHSQLLLRSSRSQLLTISFDGSHRPTPAINLGTRTAPLVCNLQLVYITTITLTVDNASNSPPSPSSSSSRSSSQCKTPHKLSRELFPLPTRSTLRYSSTFKSRSSSDPCPSLLDRIWIFSDVHLPTQKHRGSASQLWDPCWHWLLRFWLSSR